MWFFRTASNVLFCLLLTLRSHAGESAEELVQKMVERDHVLVRHRAVYIYTASETREKLDTAGKTVSSITEKTEIRGDKSPDYGTRSGKGMEANLQQAAREEPFNILNIISHYQFSWMPDEMWNNTPCFKIRFAPKGNQPYHNREEKVANNLTGYLWIAKVDDSLLHNTGTLVSPVSVAWFFASVKELEFSFDTQLLPNGEFGPSRIQYRFRVSIPFMQIHERHTRAMTNYRLIP